MPDAKKSFWEVLGPSLLTGAITFVGFQYTAVQSEKKLKAEREQSDKYQEANQKQANEKITADYRNLQETIDSTRELSTFQRSKEFRLKYYERQMAFYEDVCKLIARIAASKRLADVQLDVDRFNQTLIAAAPLFAEDPLRQLIVQFHRDLTAMDANRPLSAADSMKLRKSAFDMAAECGKSLVKTFDLDKRIFGELIQ